MEEKKTESKFYRLYELQRELLNGKTQYEKMLPAYQDLITKLKNNYQENEFEKSVIEQFEEDAKKIKLGLENINRRLVTIELLLEKAKESDEAKEIVDWFVTMVFTALGIDLSPASEQVESVDQSEETPEQ